MDSPPANSLRVVHVVDSLEPGGMENGIANLANLLAPGGVDTHVIALNRRGVFADRLPTPSQVVSLGKSPGFSWRWAVNLRKEIIRIAPDVIHTHNLGPLIYTGLADLWPGLPPIVHGEHAELDNGEKGWKRLNLRRMLYRRCAAIHTVSESLTANLETNGLRHRRLVTIPNGVDTERFRPCDDPPGLRERLGLPAPGQGFVIGMVGRFGPFKRQRLLVEAFDLLAQQNSSIWLLLVGDGGPEAASVKERVAASPFCSRIRLAGFQAEPTPWYQSINLLVLPSENEGMSNAILEAMACATPVLAQAACGCSELIDHGKTGFLTQCRTAQELAGAIQPFLANPNGDWQHAAHTARQRVMQEFSLDAMAEAYRALYRTVMAETRK
jgi:glycosyltransferase involved in cell wall biosynthesis